MEGLLVILALAACPLGMGLMMWFMSKGMRGRQHDEKRSDTSLEDLRREQGRLSAEIERLEQRPEEIERQAVG